MEKDGHQSPQDPKAHDIPGRFGDQWAWEDP